jgi:hypothetical protein
MGRSDAQTLVLENDVATEPIQAGCKIQGCGRYRQIH